MKAWYRHRFHTVAAHRIVFWAMPKVPRFLHPPIAAVTALIFLAMLTSERRAVAANLRQISGKRGLVLLFSVYRVFYSFCDLMVSYCIVPSASHAQLRTMLVDGDEHGEAIERCLREGHGVIVWTAHLGNVEFAARLLELHGRRVNVARVVEDTPAEQMLRDRMTSDRLRVINLGEGARASIELVNALRRNEIVAIQGDRVYNPRRSAALPFFGRDARFPLGPFLLSQLSGAPLVIGFVIRERWLRYRVLNGAVLHPNGIVQDEPSALAALTQAVGILEKTLASYYEQWLNFYNFWPERNLDGE